MEYEIQKVFTPKLSETSEHAAQMAYITNKDCIKQRSHIVPLLDIKNAFGEVHPSLISEILNYHHVPSHIKNIIKSLYEDFQTSIINLTSPFITVERGVLQGDCLSPILFNMCFTTFIQHLKLETNLPTWFLVE